jgi:hypothetical protein
VSTALQSPGPRARATVRKPEASTSCFAKAFPKAFGEPFPKGLPKPFPKGIDTVRRGVRPVELHCVLPRCIALHVVAVVPTLYTLYRFCTSREATGVAKRATVAESATVAERATPRATRKPSRFLPETQSVTESVTPVTKSVTPAAHSRTNTQARARVVKTTTPVVNSTTPSKPLR